MEVNVEPVYEGSIASSMELNSASGDCIEIAGSDPCHCRRIKLTKSVAAWAACEGLILGCAYIPFPPAAVACASLALIGYAALLLEYEAEEQVCIKDCK